MVSCSFTNQILRILNLLRGSTTCNYRTLLKAGESEQVRLPSCFHLGAESVLPGFDPPGISLELRSAGAVLKILEPRTSSGSELSAHQSSLVPGQLSVKNPS